MISTYEGRLILVYTYEYFCNFFVQLKEKHHYRPLPLQLPEQNVTRYATTKRFRREIRHIYTYCMRSKRRNPIRSPRELLVQQ